ncbi:MAG: UDP-3-O-acyl-N-acetylglucosamine deacetylase [bacterium]|nr:UDP-3-O-acyl-N-acetylglucosamine deacetylase [bacterium]
MQKTIAKPLNFEGLSIISNKKCSAKLLPAKGNEGIVFKIADEFIPADIQFVDRGSSHTTNLIKNGKIIKSVEHLLGAIWGMGIDNLIIEINEDGIPFFDFSCKEYAQEIKKAGLVSLGESREYLIIDKEIKISVPDDSRYAIFTPSKKNAFSIKAMVEFPEPLSSSSFEFIFELDDFLEKISWARSFIRTPLDDAGDKWERIRKLYPLLPDNPANSPLIVYDKYKFITNLATEDEPARHKIIDFLGDICLLRKRIKGEIFLYKPGHKFTYKIIDELKNLAV